MREPQMRKSNTLTFDQSITILSHQIQHYNTYITTMEYMANLSASQDVLRPTFFELVAQDEMRNLLLPAFRHVMAVYAARYPRYLLRAHHWIDEIWAGMWGLIEWWHLKEWGSSFSENFYGLKRVRNLPSQRRRHGPLKQSHIWASVFFLIGLPYIKSKLDELYDSLNDASGRDLFGDAFQDESVDDASDQRQRAIKSIKRVFLKTYPYLHASHGAAILLFQILYLFRRTNHYSPWLKLMNLEIQRMTMGDYEAHEAKSSTSSLFPPPVNSSLTGKMLHVAHAAMSSFITILKYAVPMSIFFVRFLEWWYSSGYARSNTNSLASKSRPIPPPPDKVEPHPNGIPLPANPQHCPLCLKPLTNPSSLPSGYVFCYPCIYRHVQEHLKCPVTMLNMKESDVRKIYLQK